jgi:BirA family transcriptional regulator, biotin operon repressor / biotin---[acetyl-CoA-carboxylase] ligase
VTAREPLDADRLRTALGTRWARIEVVEQTTSTNADLLADPRATDRSVLVAEHQSAGRGRFARNWVSPPRAGLTFSVLLRPPMPRAEWGWLPLLAGVAVAEAVGETSGVPVALKWPNDLLAARDGRKLAGILAQSTENAVVIGVGLNVSTAVAELPVDSATSLCLAGAEVDRTDLLVAILRRLDDLLTGWTATGIEAIATVYRGLCATLGTEVRVSVADGQSIEGRALDIDPAGRLLVRTAAGERAVSAGDVEHLR